MWLRYNLNGRARQACRLCGMRFPQGMGGPERGPCRMGNTQGQQQQPEGCPCNAKCCSLQHRLCWLLPCYKQWIHWKVWIPVQKS